MLIRHLVRRRLLNLGPLGVSAVNMSALSAFRGSRRIDCTCLTALICLV